MSDQELRIYAPTAIVGYGYKEESFQRAMERDPHVIAADGGSTDPGPNYLGMGKAFVGRDAAKRDLTNMVIAGHDRKVPVIVGTSGTAGGDAHLQWTREIVEEIARENGLHLKIALIHSELDKGYVSAKLSDGKIKPLWPMGSPGSGHRRQEQQHRRHGRGGALHRGPGQRRPGDTVRALGRRGHLRFRAHQGGVRPGPGLGRRQAPGVRRGLCRAPPEVRQRGPHRVH